MKAKSMGVHKRSDVAKIASSDISTTNSILESDDEVERWWRGYGKRNWKLVTKRYIIYIQKR